MKKSNQLIYICVCVCVCVCDGSISKLFYYDEEYVWLVKTWMSFRFRKFDLLCYDNEF